MGTTSPDKFLLTRRMCIEMLRIFEADMRHEISEQDDVWYKVKRLLETGKSSTNGTTVDMKYTPEEELTYLLDLMKRVEKWCYHKQMIDGLRVRIESVSSRLGISAIDRLGEVL